MTAEKQKNMGEVGKYLFSGLITNLSAYIVYLLLTLAGMGPKTAMSLVFVGGMLLSYNLNKKWTFAMQNIVGTVFVRFALVYTLAYVLNYSSMWLMVDRWGIPHYWVQAVNIAIISALLFIAQKYWIFSAPASKEDARSR